MHSPAASSSPSHENEEEDEFEDGVKKQGYSRRGSGWTKEEDRILTDYVKKYGEGKWKTLYPQKLGLSRSVDSCRKRWQRYLRDPFTDDEKLQILQLHAIFGNNWAQIAAELPGHTEDDIMNFCISKRRRLDHGNQESSFSSSNQHADISQLAPISYSTTTGTGSSMFGQGSGLSQFPLMVSPQTMQYNSTLGSTSVSTAATTLLDQSTGLSGNNSIDAFKAQLEQMSKTQQGSNWGTPTCSIPPIFGENFGTHIDWWSAPPVEQTQLEPKVLEGSNDDSLNPCNTKGDEQGEPNSTKKEDLNQTDLTNQHGLSDSEWEWIKNLFSKNE